MDVNSEVFAHISLVFEYAESYDQQHYICLQYEKTRGNDTGMFLSVF